MLRQHQSSLSQIYALADFIIIQIAFLLAWWLKFRSGLLDHGSALSFAEYAVWSGVYGGIIVTASYLSNFYTAKRKKRFSYELIRIIQLHLVGLLTLLSILFIVKEIHLSREFLVIFVTGSVLFTAMYRYIVKLVLKHFREKGYNKQFVLILGAGSLGRRFNDNLTLYPELGFEVIGFLDDYQEHHEEVYRHYKPILGAVDDLEQILSERIVDEVIIALPLEAHQKYGQIINVCEKVGVKAMIIPDYYDYLPAKPYFDHFAGMPLINVRDIPLDELRNRVMKRAFDIGFSLFVLVVTSPLLLVIAVLIKMTSPGPVIFKQERVGLHRRTFMMYKFRSMKVLPQETEDTGWTVADDPRRTRLGTFLRKTSLDELPQFVNVLLGQMSVVGPRPERPYFVEQFKEEIPKYMVKHHIRPGITGWAQTNGLRGDTSIEERIVHDIFYIENWSFVFDIKIIIRTIVNGFVNKNAY